jgi:hypothetical protein
VLELFFRIKDIDPATPALGKFNLETFQASFLFQSIGRSISLRKKNEICESCRADDWVYGLDPLNASGANLLREMGYPDGIAFLCASCIHHQFETPGNVYLEENIGINIIRGVLELVSLNFKFEATEVPPAQPARCDQQHPENEPDKHSPLDYMPSLDLNLYKQTKQAK